MSIILFAIIGATINAGLLYWIIFTLYVCIKIITFIREFYTSD